MDSSICSKGINSRIFNRLKFKTWNINGCISKLHGNKFENKEFLDQLLNFDIVTIVETHALGKSLDIPGFYRPFRKDRQLKGKGRKSFGGIAVFVKKELIENKIISHIPNDCQDTVWLKVNKNSIGGSEDIYYGGVYLPPKNKWNSATIAQQVLGVFGEIESFSEKGKVILSGDFNARTQNAIDFVDIANDLNPDLDCSPVQSASPKYLIRNSEDGKTCCKRGKELLDMLKRLNLLIMNGRKIGDLFGKMTCFRWNGCSVVDYGICSQELFQYCTLFRVGHLDPRFSDHTPIEFNIKLTYNMRLDSDTFILDNVDMPYWFDVKSNDALINKLKQSDEQVKFNDLAANFNAKNSSDMHRLLNLITEACNMAGLRRKRVRTTTEKKPWYDLVCQDANLKLKKVAKEVRKNPHDKNNRAILRESKKEYKDCIRKAKMKYECDTLSNIATNKGTSELFWKKCNRLRGSKVPLNKIPAKDIFNHFNGVLNKGTNTKISIKLDTGDGPLDFIISVDELNYAVMSLKTGKSTGPDCVSNEILQCLHNVFPNLLLKIFNSILATGSYPEDWNLSYLVPVHKKGSRLDIQNYRGICLISCLGKLFAKILNTRLVNWLCTNNILSKQQLGFIKGNRTTDAHIIVHNLVQKYCYTNKKKIYSCFIDFEKAFDNISRNKLLLKMQKIGISGKFLTIISNMYSLDKVKIKIDKKMTQPIQVTNGVRQGCVLSPTLFNIFLSDLAPLFENTAGLHPVHITEDISLNCLLWADDILLFSESKQGLQNQLNVLFSYTRENSLSINIDKTKSMCFSNSGKLIRNCFSINGEPIEDVKQYKYLGFVFTAWGGLKTGLSDLHDRGLKAFYTLKKALGYGFYRYPRVSIKLYEAIVKQILLYGSDYWGAFEVKRNPIEQVHISFCKQLLGVSRRTTNNSVLIELGFVPLKIDATKRVVRNWLRISNNNCNAIIKDAHSSTNPVNFHWGNKVLDIVYTNGFQNIQNCDLLFKEKFVNDKLPSILKSKFNVEALGNMSSSTSKMNLYASLIHSAGSPQYLYEVNCVSHRILLSKLRMSDHQLNVEKLRGIKVPRNSRVCPKCTSLVEDEKHFFLHCELYQDLIGQRDTNILALVPTFHSWPDHQKILTILNANGPILNFTIEFISRAIERRKGFLEFLLFSKD